MHFTRFHLWAGEFFDQVFVVCLFLSATEHCCIHSENVTMKLRSCTVFSYEGLPKRVPTLMKFLTLYSEIKAEIEFKLDIQSIYSVGEIGIHIYKVSM